MKKIHKKKSGSKKKRASAEEIALTADAGKDVSKHFTNKGKMMPAIQRVNVDFTVTMLGELDDTAASLNVSRQAVIKLLIRQALDQHYMARSAKEA